MDRTEEENLKNAKFNHEKLLKHLQEAKDTLPDIDSDAFLNAILELVKIFSIIGSAINFAFKDVITRVASIRSNFARFPQVKGGLITFIEHEFKQGIQLYSVENPRKVHDPSFKNYESTTRNLSRLMWFLDFVTVLVKHLEGDRQMKCADCAKKAYSEGLAPHHPFPVRMAAKTALTFTPSREKFMKGLFPDTMTEEEKYRAFRQALDLINPIRNSLWKYYEDHGVKNIA